MQQAQMDNALGRLCESGLAFRRGTPPRCQSTPSSTHWCRTRLTTRCSRAVDRNCTARSHAWIDQRFPNIKTTEPEVLANHLTAASLTEAAIPLWQTAGELAL